MTADHINPFLSAAISVFDSMLGVPLEREQPFVRKAFEPLYELTGVIGLSGKATGTVAVSMPAEMAMTVTSRLLGESQLTSNDQVIDAVGELTNMIAGAAKAKLEKMELSIGLPAVIVGRQSAIAFPSRATPISIPFKSPIGPLVIDVGLVAAPVG
jgi:chemotaxis protein CheX